MNRVPRILAAGAALLSVSLLVPPSGASQERPVVAIDPGHGGPDAGVEVEEHQEKDLILEISFVVGAEFAKAGYDVVYTRTGDDAVDWSERRRIAEEAGASLLLMLHANRAEDTSRYGAEVYAYMEESASARLAEAISTELRNSGSAVLVEARDGEFLRSSSVPTAMIEVAFLTHPSDRQLLQNTDYRHQLGRTLVSAAEEFLSGP